LTGDDGKARNEAEKLRGEWAQTLEYEAFLVPDDWFGADSDSLAE
jgi:hypothetical protein